MVTGTLMIVLPVLVLLVASRWQHLPWRVVGLGAACFILAQIVKAVFAAPVMALGLIAPASWGFVLFGGLLPGIFEELAKWLPLRIMRPRRWSPVIAFGLGFGGMESLYLGLQVVAISVAARNGSLPPEAMAQLSTMMVTGLAGGALVLLERISAMGLHLGLTVLNANALRAGRGYLVLVAMLIHTVADVLAGAWHLVSGQVSIVWFEAVFLLVAAALLVYARASAARGDSSGAGVQP